jgi:hypothetical protein
MAGSCFSKGTGAAGGGARAMTVRCISAPGGRTTPRPSAGPRTLWRIGAIAGAAGVTAEAVSRAGGTWVTCPLTRCPEMKVSRGTVVTAFAVWFT